MNRTLSSFALLAGIAGAYLVSLGRAHFAEIAAQRAAAQAAYERFDRGEAEMAREAELLACLRDLDHWRDQLRPNVTFAGEATSILLATTTQLENAGLVVERSEAMPPNTQLTRPHCRMHVTVSGRLASLFHAVCNLENAPLPTRVTDLTLQSGADSDSVRGEMTIVCSWSEGP